MTLILKNIIALNHWLAFRISWKKIVRTFQLENSWEFLESIAIYQTGVFLTQSFSRSIERRKCLRNATSIIYVKVFQELSAIDVSLTSSRLNLFMEYYDWRTINRGEKKMYQVAGQI